MLETQQGRLSARISALSVSSCTDFLCLWFSSCRSFLCKMPSCYESPKTCSSAPEKNSTIGLTAFSQLGLQALCAGLQALHRHRFLDPAMTVEEVTDLSYAPLFLVFLLVFLRSSNKFCKEHTLGLS